MQLRPTVLLGDVLAQLHFNCDISPYSVFLQYEVTTLESVHASSAAPAKSGHNDTQADQPPNRH